MTDLALNIEAPSLGVVGSLTQVGIRLSSHFSDSLLREFQIGLNEWRILSALAREKSASIKSICSIAGIHKTVVSRTLQKLEDRGIVLVKRAKRSVTVELNASGLELYDSILPSIRSKQAEILTPLSPEERYELDWLLSKIQKSLEQH